jgi:hypothetical protein
LVTFYGLVPRNLFGLNDNIYGKSINGFSLVFSALTTLDDVGLLINKRMNAGAGIITF